MEQEKIFDPRSAYGWVTERKTMQLLLRGFIDETQPKKILSVVYQKTGTDSCNSEKFFENHFDGLEERFWSPRVFKPQKKPWQKFDDWIIDDDLTVTSENKNDYELFIAQGEKWWDKVADDSQFDLILGMFPTDGDYHSSNFEENISFNQIFNTSLQYLSKSGLAFFTVNLEFITIHAKRIQERLKSEGLFISAVFEPGELFGDAYFSLDLSNEGDRVFRGPLPRTLIIAIRRKPVEFIFVASFCTNDQILELAKNYKFLQSKKRDLEKQGNLCEGIIIEENRPFYNFNRHKASIKILEVLDKLDYGSSEFKFLRDITVDVYSVMAPRKTKADYLTISDFFTHEDFMCYCFGPPTSEGAKSREKRNKQVCNSLFICADRRKKTDVLLDKSLLDYFVQLSDWDEFSTEHSFWQVVVNEKIVDKEFLAIYLSDGIGKLELDSVSDYLQDGHGINRDMFIHESNLMNASLLLPDIETQKSLVQTFKKITKLARNVSQFKKNLLLVPGNYEKIDDKADEMNKIFHSFSKIDKINSQIADANETDKIEYKASFHYSDRSKKKSSTNQKRALRAICGFLNMDGGKLFIGVSERDKKTPLTINGIDEEIKNLHEDSYEKFVLYFSQTIENQLSMGREEWWEFIKFEKIVMPNNKSIFEVACKFHDKGPVSLKGKEDVLYVRQYAEVKEYRGNEMKNYEREHWKK